MKTSLIKKNFKILEAWNEFINDGSIREDIIREEILSLWFRAKLNKEDPKIKKIKFKKNKIQKNFYQISDETKELVKTSKIDLIVLNADFVLEDCFGTLNSPYTLDISSIVCEESITCTSFQLCKKTRKEEEIIGAEHYNEMLQDYHEFCIPQIIESKLYYFVFLMKLIDFKEEYKEIFRQSIKYDAQNIKEKQKQDSQKTKDESKTLCTISKIGEILNLHSGKISWKSLERILSIDFEGFKINSVFDMKRQIVNLRKEKNSSFIITPISKTAAKALILIEKKEDFIKDYLKISSNINIAPNEEKTYNFTHLEETNSIKRRKTSLLNSETNFIISYNYHISLRYLGEFIKKNGEINIILENKDAKEVFKEIRKLREKSQEISYLDFYKKINLFIKIRKEENRENLEKLIKIRDKKLRIILAKRLIEETKLKEQQEFFKASELQILKFRKNEEIKFLLENNIIEESMKNEIPEKTLKPDLNLKNIKKKDKEKELYNLKQIEKETIIDALNSCKFNIEKACKLLGISKSTIYRKINEYKINTK